MNINPETDLDLEKLFLPAWAQETPNQKQYENFTGDEGARHGDRGDRGRDERRRPRPPRREGKGGRRDDRPRPQRREGREGRVDRRPGYGPQRREERHPPLPLPEVNASIVPGEKGVEQISRQIKVTGRAYPLFDIARLIVQKPDRYSIRFEVKKNAEGQPVQSIFNCALDNTLWLSEDEAVEHVLSRHFATFYQTERTPTEPPKGTYTFVAQCGMSGVILGPPNYHDYQNKLRKLHADRFARMPFEVFKSRIKIVRDEAVVKKWLEDQSWNTQYICLNMPEPLKLASREAVGEHFRQTHKDAIIRPVESLEIGGVAGRSLRGGLGRIVMQLVSDQRRFPMQIATALSQGFAQHGLQFFKVNKTVTHVCVARPHFLDMETTVVSDGVKRIVEYINAHPKCTRRQLIEALAPTPAAPLPPPATASETAAKDAETPGSETAPAEKPVAEVPQLTAEQTQIVTDLHWLIHQGHVIEFANGLMETAKKPVPRPPKPEPKPDRRAEPSTETETTPETLPKAATTESGAAPVEAAAETPADVKEVADPAALPEDSETVPSEEPPKESSN